MPLLVHRLTLSLGRRMALRLDVTLPSGGSREHERGGFSFNKLTRFVEFISNPPRA